MKKILDKRNDLERFIREQTLGPGINGYRFVDLSNEILFQKDIRTLEPLSYEEEIIDIMPAAVYSTGILFPEDMTGTTEHAVINDAKNGEQGDEQEDKDDRADVGDDIENKDTVELNQMFPKVMGFTCCLHENVLHDKKIEFQLSARYYKKLDKKKDSSFRERYGLLCEVQAEIFQEYLQKNDLLPYFTIKQKGHNSFILLNKVKEEEIKNLKSKIRNINQAFVNGLLTELRSQYDLFKGKDFYISNLKSTIYYELKNNVVDPAIRIHLYNISEQIELKENIADHLNNLIDASSGGYGLWKAEKIVRKIVVDPIHFPDNKKKISYLYKDPDENIKVWDPQTNIFLSKGAKNVFIHQFSNKKEKGKEKNVEASLSLNIQLSRDSRKKKGQVFLKIQLINTSSPFDEADKDSRYYSTFNEVVNQRSFFGVKLSLTSPHLLPYNTSEPECDENGKYDEDSTTKFIYQQFKDYGIGHGCSVKWNDSTHTVETEYIPDCETPDVDPTPRNKKGRVVQEEGTFKDPLFLGEGSKAQQFKWLSTLSDASDNDILTALNEFVDAYGEWINLKSQEYDPAHPSHAIATQELQKCQVDFERMKKNIHDLLTGLKNTHNLLCFRLMNTAMFMQLWHGVKNKQGKVKDLFEQGSFTCFDEEFYKEHADDKLFSTHQSASWRAFQLAFILLNLDGIFQPANDPSWKRRNEWVDLVWFPTGGGKTEAYLGLIALTILNRRMIHGDIGGGTAAIMRYTLRLLTMQQFQRATLMIMALELIRRWELYDLGAEPIYIGFWVGNSSIPNKMSTTNGKHLSKEEDSLLLEFVRLNEKKPNKIPFHECPWCGDELHPITEIDTSEDVYNKDRLHLCCSNEQCVFVEKVGWSEHKYRGPIPVNLCDASIYQHPPTLLFGTVDKFAQLAHKISKDDPEADSRRLFGKGEWEVGKPQKGYLPPDLIIQDELHLLLGPLGSAVALFEAAIDQLCLRPDGTRPKVISSTATTRNTELQIAAIFDRKVDLFPKPGVECDDSFYAYYKREHIDAKRQGTNYISKRKYMGFLPTGRTQIWMQMRLEAIILTHRALWELKELGEEHPFNYERYKGDLEKVMNYYHSTISYFNSLKEVGKTQSQIQSYILKEMRRVFSRVIRPQKLMQSIYTYGPLIEGELTGRLNGEEVKNELKRVERKWTAQARFATPSIENGSPIPGSVPPELIVATNMISVGIDVSRFNTILMNSMPRNTAEYIQASSRVARETYGLVLTVHHPFRARDVSHYERFIEFHEKMYSFVEPISITPFTCKAVDRYLGLYLATIMRHTTDLAGRKDAILIHNYDPVKLQHKAQELIQYFKKRQEHLGTFSSSVQNLLKEKDINYIQQWIYRALQEWHQKAENAHTQKKDLVFNYRGRNGQEQLFVDIDEYEGNIESKKWQIPQSLRVIEPEAAIHIHSR